MWNIFSVYNRKLVSEVLPWCNTNTLTHWKPNHSRSLISLSLRLWLKWLRLARRKERKKNLSIVKRFSAAGLTPWAKKINYPRPPPQSIPVTTSLSESIILAGLRRRRVIKWGEEKVKSQLGWKFKKRGRKQRLRKRSQQREEMNRDDKRDTLGGTNSDLRCCPGERREKEGIWG